MNELHIFEVQYNEKQNALKINGTIFDESLYNHIKVYKMKKVKFLLFLSVLALMMACNKLDIEKGTPKSIVNKIKDFDKSAVCDDAKVNEFNFQGNVVYTFEPGSCGADMTTEVVNTDGNTMGNLGGIAGNSQINGEDFSHAVFIKTVWEK